MIGSVKRSVHHGVVLHVMPSPEDHTYSVYFTNAIGSFEIPPRGVLPIRGCRSIPDALRAGEDFVDRHQPTSPEWSPRRSHKISVRLWYGVEKWGYLITSVGGGSRHNSEAAFATEELALAAGRLKMNELERKLEAEVAALIARSRPVSDQV